VPAGRCTFRCCRRCGAQKWEESLTRHNLTQKKIRSRSYLFDSAVARFPFPDFYIPLLRDPCALAFISLSCRTKGRVDEMADAHRHGDQSNTIAVFWVLSCNTEQPLAGEARRIVLERLGARLGTDGRGCCARRSGSPSSNRRRRRRERFPLSKRSQLDPTQRGCCRAPPGGELPGAASI
jgi:hypothetical protein